MDWELDTPEVAVLVRGLFDTDAQTRESSASGLADIYSSLSEPSARTVSVLLAAAIWSEGADNARNEMLNTLSTIVAERGEGDQLAVDIIVELDRRTRNRVFNADDDEHVLTILSERTPFPAVGWDSAEGIYLDANGEPWVPSTRTGDEAQSE
jgi:hypothetical protein